MKNLLNGYYNENFLQIEPYLVLMTTTSIEIVIWTYKNIEVYPMFISYDDVSLTHLSTQNAKKDENFQNIKEEKLPKQIIEGNTPTVIRFGSLVSLFDDFYKGPPQTKTKLTLKTNYHGTCHTIFELKFDIPKYWAGKEVAEVPEFNFLINSCMRLPGDKELTPEGFPYSIYTQFKEYSKNSNLNLLLGDNIYPGEFEYNSKLGLYNRYKKLYTFPQLKDSWSIVPWSAITDDHDLGFSNETSGGPQLYLCREILSKFWENNSMNPISPIIWSMFRYDLTFIGLDDQSFKRDPGEINSTLLGKEQIQWLSQSLYSAKKSFKHGFIFISVGKPFLPPGEDTFSDYPFERQVIIDIINNFKLKNVIFLTANSHYSDVSQFTTVDGYIITEFRNSPMSSPVNTPDPDTPNIYQVPGSLLLDYNFGKINVVGDYDKRVLTYQNILKDGSVGYTFTLNQKT